MNIAAHLLFVFVLCTFVSACSSTSSSSGKPSLPKPDSESSEQSSSEQAEKKSSSSKQASKSEGDNGQVNKGTSPKNIPSGNDDDVVARQLREAAEKEQDPELREKLWEEYRKYKKQQTSASAPPSSVN